MKLTALRLTLAAAAMLAATATASAQSMKAEIPFAFQTGHVRMQPGSYEVRMMNTAAGAPVMSIFNVDQKQHAMALSYAYNTPSTPKPANPRLSFVCAGDNCQLVSLQLDNAAVYRFHTAKDAGTRIATVVLRSDRAD